MMAVVANDLDDLGLYKEANLLTDQIIKIAQNEPPALEELSDDGFLEPTNEASLPSNKPEDIQKILDDANSMRQIMYNQILGVLDFVEKQVEMMQTIEEKYVKFYLKKNEFNKNYAIGYKDALKKIQGLKLFFEKRSDEYKDFIYATRKQQAIDMKQKMLDEARKEEEAKLEQEEAELQKSRLQSRY